MYNHKSCTVTITKFVSFSLAVTRVQGRAVHRHDDDDEDEVQYPPGK